MPRIFIACQRFTKHHNFYQDSQLWADLTLDKKHTIITKLNIFVHFRLVSLGNTISVKRQIPIFFRIRGYFQWWTKWDYFDPQPPSGNKGVALPTFCPPSLPRVPITSLEPSSASCSPSGNKSSLDLGCNNFLKIYLKRKDLPSSRLEPINTTF